MSRLDELIHEYCLDGVEFKRLGDVCLNTANISWAANENKAFRYIDLTSVDRKSHSIRDTVKINSENAPSRAQKVVKADDVIFGTTRPTLKRYCFIPTDYDGQICSTGYCVLRADKTYVLPRYIYHLISTTEFDTYVEANQRGSAYPAISDGDVKAYTIPVPPLPVQQEIVQILDKFTTLETELEMKLETELEARQKQYEYYLNFLFIFPNRPDVKYVSVGELFEFKNGLNKGKEYFGKGTPIVNFTDVFKNRYLTADKLKGRVNVTPKEIGLYSAHKGDVFFTRTSETQEEIGIVSVLVDDVESCVFSGFVLRARPTTALLLPKYCSFCFYSYTIRKEIIKNSTYTTRALTSGTKLSKLFIPVPPLEEQERIVAILDRFDALINDITQGLPAEIAARRKQYEYYRDKLLTFKEKVS